MGLFGLLLRWWNPTAAWQPTPSTAHVVNLGKHQFCGVGLGDRFERLSFLGREERSGSHFAFPQHGIEVSHDSDGNVAELAFYFGHPAEPTPGAFHGQFLLDGQAMPLNYATSEAEIVELFGPPYWRGEDADEAILFYEFRECEWQVEFALSGGLKCFSISTSILADEQQRSLYGVTKPWPPEHWM